MAENLDKQGYSAQLENQSSAPRGGVGCSLFPMIPHEDSSAQPSLLAPRSSTARWNLLLAIAMVFLAIAGCKDPNAIEKARQRGEIAGRTDGLRSGDGDGYNSTYQSAKDAAYKANVNELYDSNRFARKPTYTVIVLSSAFLLGLGFQYLVLYLLRRKELLLDIDWIVLPKDKTQVNLTQLLDYQKTDDTPTLKATDASSSDSAQG